MVAWLCQKLSTIGKCMNKRSEQLPPIIAKMNSKRCRRRPDGLDGLESAWIKESIATMMKVTSAMTKVGILCITVRSTWGYVAGLFIGNIIYLEICYLQDDLDDQKKDTV